MEGTMKALRWISRPAFAVLLVCFAGGVAEAQVDQNQLIERLRHGDRDARAHVTAAVLDMGPRHAGPHLREALISALADEAERDAASYRGEAHAETVAQMAWVVAQFEDPGAVDALVGALGTGAGAIWGLATLGEPAVRATVEAARTREGRGSSAIVTDALLALRFLAEGVGHVPLSPSSREQIIAVARERLEPKQPYVSVLNRAIDLAIVLDDPGLRATVEAIAVDPAEVEARVENPSPRGVEWVLKAAVERVSGVPPLPRWSKRW
jgi:hypothetical protein